MAHADTGGAAQLFGTLRARLSRLNARRRRPALPSDNDRARMCSVQDAAKFYQQAVLKNQVRPASCVTCAFSTYPPRQGRSLTRPHHVLCPPQAQEDAALEDVMSRQIICVTETIPLEQLANTFKKVRGVQGRAAAPPRLQQPACCALPAS